MLLLVARDQVLVSVNLTPIRMSALIQNGILERDLTDCFPITL